MRLDLTRTTFLILFCLGLQTGIAIAADEQADAASLTACEACVWDFAENYSSSLETTNELLSSITSCCEACSKEGNWKLYFMLQSAFPKSEVAVLNSAYGPVKTRLIGRQYEACVAGQL